MSLEEQSYQINDRGKIEIVSHNDLLGFSKQIIRLRDNFYEQVNLLLSLGIDVSLYNHYNPINSGLIRKFKIDPQGNNLAIIARIIDSNNSGPILDGESLKQVEVIDMQNIFFEDISIDDLKKSIAFNGQEICVANLIKWLSKEFYAGRLTVEEIQSYQKLFYRKIKSN
ncbi:MAG: hypothetical protein PHI37_02675 [Candidatus Gracilibacteria bacterium]|nr:hypothetical protein [Candidatus Gracilibacteria bacterium]